MTEYITRDSGERQDFDSGARRDISHGKPRYDLIPLVAMRRWAELMGRGAEKYGDKNWELGMPVTRFLESGLRHFYQLLEGDTSEDHAAAVLFNIAAVMHFEGDPVWDDREQPEADPQYVEWILDVLDGSEPDSVGEGYVEWVLHSEPPEEAPTSLVNWEQIRLDVLAGKLNGAEINWPEGFDVPTPPNEG